MTRVQQHYALLGALMALAGLSGAPAAADDSRANWRLRINRVFDEVARLRHLEPRAHVSYATASRLDVEAYLGRRLAEEYPDHTLRAGEQALVKFGLIPQGTDLRQFLMEFYTSQLAGYYDIETRKIYLADWLPVERQTEVIAHELVHALQDQHYDLGAWIAGAREHSDQQIARVALMEGDALTVMYAQTLGLQDLSPELLGDLSAVMEVRLLESYQQHPTLRDAPPFLVDLVTFPYVSGLKFFRAVHERYDMKSWAQVYRDPPQSSEQILHPAKYLDARDDPTPIVLPDLREALQPYWTQRDAEQMGEFGVQAIIRQFLGPFAARHAGEGWDGDQYALFEHTHGLTAIVWMTVWDSPQDADEFFAAYRQVIALKYPEARVRETSATHRQWHVASGDMLLERHGQHVLVIEGLSRSEIAAIRPLLWAAEQQG